jgi:hypothetical protein
VKDELLKSTGLPGPRPAPVAGPDSAPSAPATATRQKTEGFGLWEWTTRRRALKLARARLRDSDPRARELRRRAHAAAALGDRVFDALEPLWTGTAQHLAADLYRQSIYWSLSALDKENGGEEPIDAVWKKSRAIEGLALPEEAQARDELELLLESGDFRAFARLSELDRHRVASHLRLLAHSALTLGGPDAAVRRLLFQRFVRVVGLVLTLAIVCALGAVSWHYLTLKPNLALGKPWRASSVWGECHPEIRLCGSLRTDIFFHTKEDASPWVEFDLGAPTRISEVYVKNRSDSVPDRAVPLVLEVSDDAKAWRTLARRDEVFRTWTASFEAVDTRYVRLRVDRRSYLHLDRVEIRP